MAVKKVEFVNDRMVYIILRGGWCYTTLKVHDTTEDEIEDAKDSLCEKYGCVFIKFPKYRMNMLRDFTAKVGREDT
jgi:hypothetical protein